MVSHSGLGEQITAILEAVLQDSGHSVERSQIRRIVSDALSASLEEGRDDWWRPVIETTQSLGMKAKVIDCNFTQFLQLAAEGATLMTMVDANTWGAVSKKRPGSYRFISYNEATLNTRMSREELYVQLGVKDKDYLRCIVIEPGSLDVAGAHFISHDHAVLIPGHEESSAHPAGGYLHGNPAGPHVGGGHGHESISPTKLLWRLLRPEWSDIWIVVVFAMVAGMLALATPLAIESLVNTVAFGNVYAPVVVLSLILFAFLLFLAAIRGVQTYVVEIIQRRLFARVVADLAYRLPRAEMTGFHGHDPRELVNRFFDVVTVQKVSATLLLDGVSLILSTLIGMAVLAFYHPWLLGFDVLLLGAIAMIIFVLGRGAISTSVDESFAKYATAAWLQDLAGCPKTFRHFGGVELAMERADRYTHQYLSQRKRHFNILLRQILFALLLQAIASTALLGLGGWLVVSGQLTLGQLVAAELIVTIIVSSFAKLGKHMESYYDLLAAMNKLGHLFALPIASQSGLVSLKTGRPASIEMVHLGYVSPHGHEVLSRVNLIIGAGERWAITGPSSSGKSTLLDLLFGLKEPTEGHLTIDRFDPRDIRPDVLRRHVVLVSDVEVFTGTLAENLHLQRPDITMPMIRDALEHVGLLDEILKMPQGLETRLLTGGSPLTQSQARRLMLARAIVARPGLLLIDEILDSLPDEEAEAIMSYLTRPEHPWTLIVVTGRRSLAAMCEYRLKLLGHTAVPEMGVPRLMDPQTIL